MNKIFADFIPFLFLLSCQSSEDQLIKIEGNAQGTTYHISYYSDNPKDLKFAVDSILTEIDFSLSTYNLSSIISRINKNESETIVNEYFLDVFNKSMEVSEKTNGDFDITVAPVINAWGFGFTKKTNVDSSSIDSLLQFVGYHKLKLQQNKIVKDNPNVMLDFNAIAQGYSVDILGSFLEKNDINNYMVELGGELMTKGKKKNKEIWKIGIDKPIDSMSAKRDLQAIVELNNQAMATSGNYRKYYEENGQKYAHIIDPHTGYPSKNNLLSATVFAKDCMTADAYATAFMVMGLDKAKQFLMKNSNLQMEVYFIYDDSGIMKTFVSENLKKSIKEIN